LRNSKIVIILGSVVMVIAMAGLGLKLFLGRPLPPIAIPPAPAMPADNGFDDCLRAVSLLKDADRADKLSADDRREARALLQSNREAMEIVRQALGKAYMTPRPNSWDEEWPYLREFRRCAGLFRLDGQLKASRGDYRGAAESFLDARRFGAMVPTGGWLVHWTLGAGMSEYGYAGLEEIVGKMDKATCLYVLSELRKADMREPMFGQVLQGEEVLGLMFLQAQRQGKVNGADGKPMQPLPPMIDRLMSRGGTSIEQYQSYMRRYRAESSKPFYLRKPPADPEGAFSLILAPPAGILTRKSIFATQGQILKLMIALRLDYLEDGKYPASIADVQPSSLVFMDEFTGDPLKYKVTSDGYLLYSVGPDGKDDGGAPLRNGRNSCLGDITAGKLFPPKPADE